MTYVDIFTLKLFTAAGITKKREYRTVKTIWTRVRGLPAPVNTCKAVCSAKKVEQKCSPFLDYENFIRRKAECTLDRSEINLQIILNH